MSDTRGSTRGRPAMAQLAKLADGSRPGSAVPPAWQESSCCCFLEAPLEPRAGKQHQTLAMAAAL